MTKRAKTLQPQQQPQQIINGSLVLTLTPELTQKLETAAAEMIPEALRAFVTIPSIEQAAIYLLTRPVMQPSLAVQPDAPPADLCPATDGHDDAYSAYCPLCHAKLQWFGSKDMACPECAWMGTFSQAKAGIKQRAPS